MTFSQLWTLCRVIVVCTNAIIYSLGKPQNQVSLNEFFKREGKNMRLLEWEEIPE